MSGAWVACGNPPRDRLHSTDPVAARLCDLHFLLGQGPGADAVRVGRPVPAPDLSSAPALRAWPMFAGPALATGARALVTVPLLAGPVVIGLFGMYARDPVTLADEQHLEIVEFADIALGLLLDRRGPPPEDAARWLAGEAVVHQASGIIAVQLGVGVAESLDRLRAHAFAYGRPLLEIAREVVAHRLRFRPPPETGPNNAPNA